MRLPLDQLYLPSSPSSVETICWEFREAHVAAVSRRKSGRILKIILFGLYLRGDEVDSLLSANQYKTSDGGARSALAGRGELAAFRR